LSVFYSYLSLRSKERLEQNTLALPKRHPQRVWAIDPHIT
jgi:hypothetical protein